MTRTIAIDFDGTLCTNEFPDIGKPYWGVIYAALKEQSAGAQLILWTCREGELLDAAVKACKKWGLTFDAINDSTPEWKEMFGGNPRKVGATEYWDDKAVAVYQGELDTSTHFMELVDLHTELHKERLELRKEIVQLKGFIYYVTTFCNKDEAKLCQYCVHGEEPFSSYSTCWGCDRARYFSYNGKEPPEEW